MVNLAHPKSYSLFKNCRGAKVSENFKIGKYHNLQINLNSSIIIEENVVFREFCNVLVAANSKLIINKNVFFNNYSSINCLEKIEIGENTLFGEGVKIYDHNHDYEYKNQQLNICNEKYTTEPVIIGKNCWIGSNVTILKGVKIGSNVIIGANNLIYKSIEPGLIIKAKTDYNIQLITPLDE
jgi:acetyltransferase-like isoleucine patch superfamily enzyme